MRKNVDAQTLSAEIFMDCGNFLLVAYRFIQFDLIDLQYCDILLQKCIIFKAKNWNI